MIVFLLLGDDRFYYHFYGCFGLEKLTMDSAVFLKKASWHLESGDNLGVFVFHFSDPI